MEDLIIQVSRLMEEVIKDYEKVETYYILINSENKERDFKLLESKMKEYRNRLNKVLSNERHKDTEQAGACPGESDIQKESLRIL